MAKISPLYDGIKMMLTVTSDNHIDEKHPMPVFPMWYLEQSLKDSSESEYPVDAYITVGDTTSRGSRINWEMTEKCFSKYNPAKRILLALGNHDTWNDDGYEEAIKNYFEFTEKICGVKRDKVYFREEINGYSLIFLGSDDDSGCEANFSDEEIKWFDEQLAYAVKDGKPAFVFNHQSLNEKHGLPKTWDEKENADSPMDGGIGEKSEEIEKILKKYKNVYYFSGHSHMGLCGEMKKKYERYSSFEEEDGLVLVNLPSLACKNHHGDTSDMGIGVVIEVYENKVVIRPRSFSRKKMNKKIMIKDSKPYFEKEIRQ